MSDLIGYLTGALDPEERQQIEDRLEHDAELRDELRKLAKKLAPLDDFALPEYDPPNDLSRGVFDLIDAVESTRSHHTESAAPAGQDHAQVTPAKLSQPARSDAASARTRWAIFDVVALSCVFIVGSAIFATSIAGSHYQAQIATCSRNLMTIGLGLSNFSEIHEGSLPSISPRGKTACAGIYGPTLVEQGYLETPEFLICPGSELARRKSEWRQPTCRELEAAEGIELVSLQRDAGGSYGYTLGYVVDGKYYPTRHEGRTHFALMADLPSAHLAARQSSNHAGRGQNVLYDDFSVRFVTCAGTSCGDPIYENRHGLAAAGADREDAVIAGGATSPLINTLRP